MKFFVSLVCSLVVTTTLIAQSNLTWSTLNTGTTKKINDIYFHSPDTGYIVGENYLFKKTTNGGQTWTNLIAPFLGQRPNNNGNIVGIDYFPGVQFGQLNAGLYLIWEKPYHGNYTNNDGQSYGNYPLQDSNQFCSVEGLLVSPANKGNDYIRLYTYGQDCGSGDAVLSNSYNGPFSSNFVDTSFSHKAGAFTSIAADSFSTIVGHSNGYLLRYDHLIYPEDSIFLDSSGVAAVAFAGNHKWYAHTKRNFNNMYVSVDSGRTFTLDRSYVLFLNPKINEFSFLENGTGIAAATSSVTSGAIIVQKNNNWDFYITPQPLNATQVLANGTAYVAGDSGLMMKTDVTTSINKINTQNDLLNVYPNPTDDYLQLIGLENLSIESVQLFDMRGKLVQDFPSSARRLNLSEYPKGTYIIKVITEETQLSKKVIVR